MVKEIGQSGVITSTMDVALKYIITGLILKNQEH